MGVLEATPGGGGQARFGARTKGNADPQRFKRNLGLLTLIFQNSVLIIIMHYSRTMRPSGDHRYFPSTAVFLTELLKLLFSLTLALQETRATLAPATPLSVAFRQVYNAVFAGDGWKLAVLASFYTLQNILQYVAIGNLDAVQFQVLYQLKILTTAIFSVYLLRRSLGAKKWFALLLLTLGVSVVSLPPESSKGISFSLHDISEHFFEPDMGPAGLGVMYQDRPLVPPAPPPNLPKREEPEPEPEPMPGDPVSDGDDLPPLLDSPPNYSLGVTSILTAAAVSGLTSVYFEKLVKHPSTSRSSAPAPPPSIWIRNTQMSFYALIASFLGGVVYQDGADIAVHGFFEGYNWVVWLAVVLQTFGGVVASLVIRDADNIVKVFATSISIVVSFVASVWLFDMTFGGTFLIGTSLVLLATYLYALPERRFTRARPPAPLRFASLEKATIENVNTPRTPDLFGQKRLGAAAAAHSSSEHNTGSGQNTYVNNSGGGGGGGNIPSAGERYSGRLQIPDSAGLGVSTSRPGSPMLPRSASWRKLRED